MKKIKLTIILTILSCFCSCTAINELNLMSSNQETQLGIIEFEKYKKSKKISRNLYYNSQLRRVGRRLASVINLPNVRWEFIVFEDNTPNAFALPGGKIGVNSGLFKITQNDAGLAAVIGHEIAHVVRRHGGKSATRKVLVNIGDAIMKSKGVSSGVRSISQVGASLIYDRPFSRNNELEADKLGAIYMARAGYHPHEAVKLWKRFASYKARKGANTPQFLSTHPIDSTRIAQLEAFLPTAMAQYNKKSTGRRNYSTNRNFMPQRNYNQQQIRRQRIYRAKAY